MTDKLDSRAVELLHKLAEIETHLNFDKVELWQSKLIDYAPPLVKRLWQDIDDRWRVNLHVIYYCEAEKALIHTHSMPSAVHVFPKEGNAYRMGLGTVINGENPKREDMVTMICYSHFWYAMTKANQAHYVAPLKAASYSITLIDKANPFPDSLAPKSPKELKKIPVKEMRNILREFKSGTRWGFE